MMLVEGTDELTLNRAVGHIEGTALPGESGNVGIAGHRDGFFRGLQHLELGDALSLTTLAGVAHYRVAKLEVVEPSQVDVLAPTEHDGLTLVTCYPFYYVGNAPQRFIVHARQVRFERGVWELWLAISKPFIAALHGHVLGSGLEMAALPPERKSLYVASGDFTRVGNLDFFPVMKEVAGPGWKPPDPKALNEAALHQVNPFFLLEGLPNNLFSYLSALYEMMGPNGSMSSLSSCGAQALEFGDRVLRQGGAEAALIVGCGSWVDPLILFELAGLGVLSKAAEGADSFRPFDRRRDGFLAGEGAAALLLETAESAAARGARPLGRVLGAGNYQEAGVGGHIPIPEEAAVRACREALADAALAPADLAFVLPHGSGTPKGDRSELRALRGLLGEAAGAVPLSGLKPYTGHMGAASDVGELILGLRALAEGELPPTPGFERAEREFAGLDILSAARPVAGSAFLSLSHSIGGQTSATVVGAP